MKSMHAHPQKHDKCRSNFLVKKTRFICNLLTGDQTYLYDLMYGNWMHEQISIDFQKYFEKFDQVLKDLVDSWFRFHI